MWAWQENREGAVGAGLCASPVRPWVGRAAQRWGRRPFLLIGFSALVLRGLLFAATGQPHLIVLIQILDGISAAVLGVLVPLTVADITRGSGHFNLAQGTTGCAMGIGASISTVLTGYIADNFIAVQEALRLTRDDVVTLARNSILASFLPETDKAHWLKKIDAYAAKH